MGSEMNVQTNGVTSTVESDRITAIVNVDRTPRVIEVDLKGIEGHVCQTIGKHDLTNILTLVLRTRFEEQQ